MLTRLQDPTRLFQDSEIIAVCAFIGCLSYLLTGEVYSAWGTVVGHAFGSFIHYFDRVVADHVAMVKFHELESSRSRESARPTSRAA